MDTGAAVTAVPAVMATRIGKVLSSDKTLRGAGNQKLKVAGKAVAKLSLGDKEVEETVYLVEGLVTPLLGKPAISSLNILKFIDEVRTDTDWVAQFPKVFEGLGTMENEVVVTLKDQYQPFSQAVLRRIAAARKKPLLEELTRMERMGVIEKVEEPTEWCAPCIVLPKPNARSGCVLTSPD